MKIRFVIAMLMLAAAACAARPSALEEWMVRDGRPQEKPVWQGTMLVSQPENGRPPVIVFYMGRVPMDPDTVQMGTGKLVGEKYIFKPPAGTSFTEVWLERGGEEVAVIAPLPTGCRFLASLLPLGPGRYQTSQQKISGQFYSVDKGTTWTWCGGFGK